MNHVIVGWIGNKIKSLRNQNNLSLKDLSNLSKVSKSLISKIENNRTIPSLPVFLSILEALNTSPKDFFDDMYLPDGKNSTVIRKADRMMIEKEGRQGFLYESILSQNLLNLAIDIEHLTISPNANYIPTSTDGYEFKLILSGSLEYVIDKESTTLHEGDAIFFDARLPHFPKSTSEEVKMLVIYFILPD
ncbi:MAG: DNA-binding protein [Flammeovirgaceae bacterium]|nr:DNA-binding protein [Flammeovirgaceae bacterium]MBE61338.1 DNA-binding protein [Flammeovirgaceae bacterium]HCX23525.1 DNA-binding protein [Cytophagales bacterium]